MDASVIDRLAQARVVVGGDVLLDRFVEGKVGRVSPEAPVAVLNHRAERLLLGGAGNVAANLDARISRISTGLESFSGRGLDQVEDFVRESQRAIQRIEQAITELQRNPQRIISGGEGTVRQFDGRARR